MTAARILTQAQAEAVYSAMCALNNVGVVCGDLTLNEGVRVQWLERVTVLDGLSGPREEYPDQSAFAATYGLTIAPEALPPATPTCTQSGSRCGWTSDKKAGDVCSVCGMQITFLPKETS